MNNEPKKLYQDALRVLKDTSRTFYIPITLLKPKLKKTVASAYLCMRAIDEIEDHEELSIDVKSCLLTRISHMLESNFSRSGYQELIQPYHDKLPEVTIRLADWLDFCPNDVVSKVMHYTGVMANGMAKWAKRNWDIITKEDFDDYTFYVAGLVGVMLSEIWQWYDDVKTDQDLAIGFGRALQCVNILRNQDEDYDRGVNFLPNDWTRGDLFNYADQNLQLAKQYIETLTNNNIKIFCLIPYKLADKTLSVMKKGREKMTRSEVKTIVAEIIED